MVSLVMVTRGISWWKASLWSIFSSIGQPIMAVPAFMFVKTLICLLPYGLGFAGGAMIYVVLSELIPEASEHLSSSVIALVFAISGGVLFKIVSHEI